MGEDAVMPCTYDPSPQEIKQAQELKKKKREEERKAYTDKINELAVENCRFRYLIVAMAADSQFAREFSKGEEFKRIWEAQVEHRKRDQARAVQELSELLTSNSDSERVAALDKINAIMKIKSDHELLFTRMF